MKYPIGTNPGLGSPPPTPDRDLLTGSPGTIMTGAVDGSAADIPARPASLPLSAPERPTAPRQDVPRSFPHHFLDCGGHCVNPSECAQFRRLCKYSNLQAGGGDSAGAPRPDGDVQAPRSVIDGSLSRAKASAVDAYTGPELRGHAETLEPQTNTYRFFPARDASASSRNHHDSKGTASASTSSHRQAGVPLVPIARATRDTSTPTQRNDFDHLSPSPPRRTLAQLPSSGLGNSRFSSFNNAATTPKAQASAMNARSEGQQAEPKPPTAHHTSNAGAALSSTRGFPAGFSRASGTAFGNPSLGGPRLGAGLGSPPSLHSDGSFASSDDRCFGIGVTNQPSPARKTPPSGFAATPAARRAVQTPHDYEAFYQEQAFQHQLAAYNPAMMELLQFRDPSLPNPHVRGPTHDAAAEQAILARYIALSQDQPQSADEQYTMSLYARSERNPLVDQAALDEAARSAAVPAPDDRPPYHMYVLHRGVGVYTPLVPADMLPPLVGVPRQVTNVGGMWVLPPPKVAAPDGHWVYDGRIAVRAGSQDNIAQSASPPSQHQFSPASATQNPYEGHASLVYPPEDLQFAADHFRPLGWSPPHKARIDGIVAARSANQTRPGTVPAMPATTISPVTPQPQRRVKIYCDKWVHEGICAFTQQGCKYKHEMPQDRATQHSLGLFHGLPAWWRKQQGELARSTEQQQVESTPTTPVQKRFGGPRFGQRSVTVGGGGLATSSWRAGAKAGGGAMFGVIGPPSHGKGQAAKGRGMLGALEERDEEREVKRERDDGKEDEE